ncbi:hypothetical protein CH330_04300 [candidate division WOR-3 bacterium JGI_Cruoil_03_51_56]|uniref:DUF4870 domain-containing protein n=1 Tax=candidate division WOR-3 bacterium JGI_Cruoil_03_51_56 TaxID=1973747 RepID=A0A235BUJ1_UNCW3|nr:MAG: hypothetical protein CH330_04300 [candidate division WOR-3 bacterium JGI_Cruoil_03_51_56]
MEQEAGGQEQENSSQGNTVLAAIGYLPMLFFLPLLAGRSDRFAQFHGRQSLAILLVFIALWIAIWVVDLIFGRMMGNVILLGFIFKATAWFIHNIVGVVASLLYIAAMIAGIIQAALGRYWRVPVISAYAQRLGL